MLLQGRRLTDLQCYRLIKTNHKHHVMGGGDDQLTPEIYSSEAHFTSLAVVPLLRKDVCIIDYQVLLCISQITIIIIITIITK